MNKKKTILREAIRENTLTEKSGAEISYEIRCKKMQTILVEKFPGYKKEIDKIFESMINHDPIGVAEVLQSNFELRLKKDIGKISKSTSDAFAKAMSDKLEIVRSEGHTSMRKIATRFNELGIKSMQGGKWSHNTVKNLIHRRKDLGLE